ncbi:hypothetical protein HMPREF9413_2220 [Paenibacillus sp. HGF7]|nr:hypothetical protein HMPREF9413_2220 [Paenibacillus sp. HGF7]
MRRYGTSLLLSVFCVQIQQYDLQPETEQGITKGCRQTIVCSLNLTGGQQLK